MKKLLHFDYWIFGVVAILLILGILILANISADFSQKKFGTSTYHFFHQTCGIGIGLLLGLIAYIIPLSFIKKRAWIFVFFSLFLMVLVFIPGLSMSSSGASRWIDFKFFTFQPSELLKLTFILYLSAWLAARTSKKVSQKEKKDLKFTLVPFLFILSFVFVLLYLQSDASTFLLICTVALLIYFISDTPFWHICFVFLMILVLLVFLVSFTDYRFDRIMVFFGFMDDPMGVGFQIKQSLITIGSGGVSGLGLGMSSQRFLPQTMSDSIFAIFAEEFGFIGSFGITALFLIFLYRAFLIAKKSKDKFSRLAAVGIGSWVCIQAFINIGAMIEIVPLTGIPLPFISYGSSHIIVELIGIGILLNISKSIKK